MTERHTQPGADTDRVDVRSDLPYSEFVEQYVRPNRPVVITDATKDWAALDTWTPEFFRNRYSSRAAGANDLTIAGLIDSIVTDADDGAPNERPYLRNVSIDQQFPELRADIEPEPVYLQPNWFHSPLVPRRISQNRTDLFIGGRGSAFPYLHFDNYHGYAFIFQIYGAKQFVLVAPEHSDSLYPSTTANGVNNVSQVDDPLDPDLERFPLFARTTPVSVELTPGDTLFVPAGWWHTARMHGPSISVSSNVANRHNWAMLAADYRRSRHDRPAARLAGSGYLALVRLVETTREALSTRRHGGARPGRPA